jgi:hypothetical protein
MSLRDKLTEGAISSILKNSEDYPGTLDTLLRQLDKYEYVHELPWDLVRSLYTWIGHSGCPIGLINPYILFKGYED